MKISEFINDDNFLHNLDEDLFMETFDLEAIAKLPNTEFEKQRVRLLSQWLVGNVSETFAEIAKMDKAEQCRTLETWLDLVKDPTQLRLIGKSICWELIKGDAP